MADKLKKLSPEEQERILDRVVEKPRRERQRRLLKLGYDAPDVVDAVGVYAQTIIDMNELLNSQEWLAGNDFSLADAAMAPYFQTLHQFGWGDWYEAYAKVADWYGRCRERKSYQQGVEADFTSEKSDDLAARGAPAWAKIQSILAERSSL